MSRKAIAVAAVAAVLTVSACSSEKTADIDGATLMSKVSSKLSSNTQKGDKIFTKDGVLTASIDFEAKAPSSSGIKEGKAKGDLEMKVDSEKHGIAIKAKGDFKGKAFKDVSKGMSDKGSGSIEAYGEKTNDGGYRVYFNANDKQWKYTSVGKSDYQSFLNEVQKSAKQQSGNLKGKIDKFMNDAKQYVDIDVKENGDDYIATVTPKDVVINQLVSQAGKEGVKINKNDVKVKLVVTTKKSDYSLKELKADVDIKSTDDKFSLKGNANMKIEEKEVSIDVPKSAKNGTSVPLQELLGSSSSKAFSQD